MNEHFEKRIIELETKLTYQDDVIESLNTVIIDQQKELLEFSLKLDQLIKHVTSDGKSNIKDITDEVPPPHY